MANPLMLYFYRDKAILLLKNKALDNNSQK